MSIICFEPHVRLDYFNALSHALTEYVLCNDKEDLSLIYTEILDLLQSYNSLVESL